ncbi:hypothetical protein [Rhodothermus marinus]|uniref:hypothetical protein n=1 Tax=Rhodothermus marinus TaxID=29549 RepID=UPI000AF2C163|nr:hypothetical protein [Rhodothermus marinus]
MRLSLEFPQGAFELPGVPPYSTRAIPQKQDVGVWLSCRRQPVGQVQRGFNPGETLNLLQPEQPA